MKTMKKWMALLLTAALVLSVCCVFAEGTESVGKLAEIENHDPQGEETEKTGEEEKKTEEKETEEKEEKDEEDDEDNYSVEDVIYYEVENDETVKLRAADFENVSLYLTGENLSYVTFVLPSSAYGALWYAFDGDKEEKVTASAKYYRNASSSSNKALSDVSFVPRASFVGEVSIFFHGYTTEKDSFSGEIVIDVTQGFNMGDLDKITYYMDPGDKLQLSATDINAACRNAGFTLSYVKFILPDPDDGVLYSNYKSASSTGTKVKASTKYYRSSSSSSYLINDITFVASKWAGGTVEIVYSAFNSDDEEYVGVIRIKFEGMDEGISYSVKGESVNFVAADFNDVCMEETGAKLSYVKFSLPTKGTLYYDYDNEEDGKATVKTSSKYYYSKSPRLYNVSYFPKDNYEGTVYVDYTGYSVDGNEYSGTVTIKVKTGETEEADDISYTVKNNSYKALSASDFSTACSKATGSALSYVKFSSPSSGTLYYNYSGSNGKYDHKVTSSEKYYKSEEYYLKYVTYVPKSSYSGTVTINYTGYSVNDERFSGTIKVKVSDSGTSSGTTTKKTSDDEDEADDIKYSGNKGEEILFNGSDFNAACRDVLDYTLSYVKFTVPSTSSGELIFDYDGDDEATIKSSTKCYYKSTDPTLSNISFIPAKTGTITINYKGYSVEDETFTGSVVIKVSGTGKNANTDMANFKMKNTYKTSLFDDIDEDEWYGANKTAAIKNAYRYGLMQGKGNKKFDAKGNLTIAEAITIAARIADIYYGDETEFGEGKKNWYDDYVDYAIEKEIIDEDDFPSYNATTNRAQMAYIFSRVLPKSELEAINSVKKLPDVGTYDEYYKEILFLYNAGILTGNDEKGTFAPDSKITRAEVSAILVRIVDPEERCKNKF